MSWEYSKFEAKCESCGREGYCIRGSDDWNRFSTTWEGFESESPNPTLVGRKKTDSRNKIAVCDCGNSKIVVSKLVESQ